MISLREELQIALNSMQGQNNGGIWTTNEALLNVFMDVIEARATKAYSDFIG